MALPIVAIPVGDPTGIGPEIVLRALCQEEVFHVARPLVIGDRGVLEKAQQILHTHLDLNCLNHPSQGRYQRGTLDFLDQAGWEADRLEFGRAQAAGARVACQYLEAAAHLAVDGSVHAVAAGPVSKEAMRLAGQPSVDQADVVARLASVSEPATMLEVNGLRIFCLTQHVPLRQACDAITRERILAALRGASVALERLGIRKPRLAVAALNPHAGERGLFGVEEQMYLEPAIAEARADGLEVHGPIGADLVFPLAKKGAYDAVLTLYHDQGRIAAKMIDEERAISVITGMSFPFVTVDHGTAFDIAGKGIANPVGMLEAIRVAARYAPSHR